MKDVEIMKPEITSLIKKNKADYIAFVAKSVLPLAPIVGGVLSEIVTELIPNQKLDRVIYFLNELDSRVLILEKQIKLIDNKESLNDLIDGTLEYVQKSKKEKIDYFVNNIENGLILSKEDFSEEIIFAKILNELDEKEIIWLRFYFNPFLNGDQEFRNKYPEILEKIIIFSNADEETKKKSTFQEYYLQNLIKLNLLETVIEKDTRTNEIKYDTNGNLKIKSYKITILGKFLLKHIGLIKDIDNYFD